MYDLGVTIVVVAENGRLSVRTEVAKALQTGHLTGLLGNFDGDPSNDVRDYNGTVLGPNGPASLMDKYRAAESC